MRNKSTFFKAIVPALNVTKTNKPLLQLEKALYIIIFVYNKLRASEHADEKLTFYLIFTCWEQFWEFILTKHFDEALLKHFRMIKLEFRMLWNEIGPLDGPVLCCPITK